MWRYVLTIDVKGDDPTIVGHAGPKVTGYPSALDLARAEQDERPYHFRVVPGGLGREARVRLDDTFRKVWRSGGRRSAAGTWVVNVDELRVLYDLMGMKDHLTAFYVMGRSKGITMIGSTQRPAHVAPEFYDQPRWFWFGKVRDRRTLRRMSEIGGDTNMLMDVLPSLDADRHEFLVLGPGNYSAITMVE